MLCERRVDVDHRTIYRWGLHYAAEMERRLRWQYRPRSCAGSWRVDETDIKVKGKWKYLYRAVSKRGDTIDFTCRLLATPKLQSGFLPRRYAL